MPNESKGPGIPTGEYAGRRKKLRTSLKKAVALVMAGEGSFDQPFRPHPHFEYLTGITGEPGAVLMIDPTHPVTERREVLFLKPRDPEMERWDGYRPSIDGELRQATGIEAIHRTYHMSRFLTEAARRSRRLACVHPFASYTQPVSPDLSLFQKISQRIPGMEIEDHTEVLAKMRASKSAAEVKVLQRAVDITALGYEAVLKSLRPGMTEFDVQETLEHTYKSNGSRGTAYNSVAGAGMNATVLHYRANTKTLEKGEMICIDSAGTYGAYTADITRTLPVSGKFTPRQKEVYEIVLKAQIAAIRATKSGATLGRIDAAARKVIQKAGFGDAFIHGIGHHLGIEVHDISPDAPLQPGAVVTIEPGIYLPDEKLGIRIEDDILVTPKGNRNLSSKIPKTVADIEKAMAGRRKR